MDDYGPEQRTSVSCDTRVQYTYQPSRLTVRPLTLHWMSSCTRVIKYDPLTSRQSTVTSRESKRALDLDSPAITASNKESPLQLLST